MTLDLPTVVALTALSAFLMGASIVLAGHTQSSSDPAMSRLGNACLAQSLGWFLIGLRHQIPDALSIFGGNIALLFSSLCYLLAVNVFLQGSSAPLWSALAPGVRTLLWVGGGCLLAALLYFSFAVPSIAARIVLSSLSRGLVYTVCAFRLRNADNANTGEAEETGAGAAAKSAEGARPSGAASGNPPQRGEAAGESEASGRRKPLPKSRRIVAAGFGLGVILEAFRFLMVMLDPPQSQEFVNALSSQTASVMFSHIAVVMLTFLFVLMVHDRTACELRELVTHDYLTGILNRSAFEGFSRQAIEQARRSGESLSLLLFDVDNFKGINDTLGHLTGDVALRSLADLALQKLRSQDIFGRYGGEEFAILLPATDAEGALLVAERIRESVANAEYRDDSTRFRLTISIGVTSLSRRENLSTEQRLTALFRAADGALYDAKRAGRNRTRIAAPETEKASELGSTSKAESAPPVDNSPQADNARAGEMSAAA